MAPRIRAIGLFLLLLPLIFYSRASAEQFYLPAEVVELADKYATEEITSELIQAVIWTESRGRSTAISADGYNIGLMQLHIWYFSGDLKDPENNVQQGAAYLQSLYDKFGDLSVALMAYHGEADLTKEPSYYARSILELSQDLPKIKTEAAIDRIKAKTKHAWRFI